MLYVARSGAVPFYMVMEAKHDQVKRFNIMRSVGDNPHIGLSAVQ